ncbi:hypothetical protein EDB81DRAFT_408083 [Dactylonectria macrodidyma]|uniref:Uncharacterized protein n=1 Tax=Dactylonectria macrodidyma TaxID=307937 RepID=A0A9P9FAQ1_9HYPO|nr:hypothetical protein EDB81DRAFT_408083 [Dactylonectria macrodidyma]
MATKLEILHAYRSLYREVSKAVLHARPARDIARGQVRTAFTEPDAVFNPEGIRRTTWFLQCAAREKGFEHTILKNLLRVHEKRAFTRKGWKQSYSESKRESPFEFERRTRYLHYDMTVAMLNKTMGLLLR